MNSKEIYICPICGTKHNKEPAVEECPTCDWIISYSDNENEYDEVNHMSMAEAKANYRKGLNIWGKPLKKLNTESDE